MTFFTTFLRTLTISALFVGAAGAAHAVDTPAKQALVYDFETGTVLLSKNADEQMPPSSMSKLMTVLMVFDRLKEGSLSLDDTFGVSKKAWQMGGSKMFVLVDNEVRVEDLLRGIIIQSGNDACVVVAEGLSGTEEEFADAMNLRAKELGLKDSHFTNATGWPDPNHYVTARDLGRLAHHLIEDYPDHYHYFGEKEFTWADITQPNRNPLLYRDLGADGLKTGHTEAAGYGLVGSAKQGDRRVILVVNGLTSVRERSRESARLIEWAFREFKNVDMFSAGEKVVDANVWLGSKPTVPLVLAQDLKLTLSRQAQRKMKVTARYDEPIAAPFDAGTQVGELVITGPDMEEVTVPLLAGETIGQLGAFGRIKAAIGYLLWGAQTNAE